MWFSLISAQTIEKLLLSWSKYFLLQTAPIRSHSSCTLETYRAESNVYSWVKQRLIQGLKRDLASLYVHGV